MAEVDGHGFKVLCIDDDPDVLEAIDLLLSSRGINVVGVNDPGQAVSQYALHRPDAILLDLNFKAGARSGEEGLDLLRHLLAHDRNAAIVVLTAHSGVSVAVAAMRLGAVDFVMKPWSNSRLVDTMTAAIALGRERRNAGSRGNEDLDEKGPFLGSSAATKRLREQIEKTGAISANVLIFGEAGVGKALAAFSIHRAGHASRAPFITILAERPKADAILSEIDTALEEVAANGGTIFLRDIGKVPISLQVELARSLTRARTLAPASRVIASTQFPRARLYADTVFLPELRHQLNTAEIHIPPLHERSADVEPIAQHYLGLFEQRHGRPQKSISAAALSGLQGHHWSGNVETLKRAAERAVIQNAADQYELSDFGLPAPAEHPGQAENLNLEKSERTLVEKALQLHRYNVSQAALDLGLTRAALYRRMEKHGL